MDEDLERSVGPLGDASSSTIRGLFKKNTRKNRSEIRKDLSITFLPYEMSACWPVDEDFTLNGSIQGDNTTVGSNQTASPWNATIDNLYMEFFETLQGLSAGHDILEVVSELGRSCSEALRVIQSLKEKVARNLAKDDWLEKERNTWRLIFVLYRDRLVSQNVMDDDVVDQYYGRSEKACVESLFRRDSLVRECQIVIDWLECNAAEKDDEVLHFSDSSVGWENTLHQLQSAETIAFGSSRQIVSQMDPDAPHYQKRPLHDLDVEDGERLSRKIFQEIRCGKLEEAQKLCRESGHSWKAAQFEGWRLFHDPNIENSNCNEEETSREIEGNSNRDIWKLMALRYCKQDYVSPYEKAALGVFCGSVNAVLPVCKSWDDHLWTYMKSVIDIRVESEIRDSIVRNNPYTPLPDDYWAQRMSLDEIFSQLESSKNALVREQSSEPERVIQKYIILEDIARLLHELEEWVEDPNVSTHFLRFCAHLVLFLDHIGRASVREIVHKTVESYVRRLMDMKETQLVAYYVSKLKPGDQIHIYAQYLEGIIDNNERKTSLMYAEDSGLNVLMITKQVVENIRNKPHYIEPSDDLQHKITEMDTFKISALEWVTFYDSQKLEALIQSNALIFAFLTLGKLDAAQLAFNKVPSDAVEKLLSEGDVEEEVNVVIKEHLSYKAYLEAYEAFNEWFKQCKRRPSPPEELPENAQFPEKVAYQHRVSQYAAELERWKLTTNHAAKTAKTMLYNVLLFPEGWLVGAKDAEYLRSICIPEVVLMLYSVLSESGMHEECLQLADIVASEKYCLYKVYSKEKLGELLVKLCENSVKLLNSNKDPWGNDTTA